MNYRGQPVELAQNNTDVAVPLLVSSKNYGILWDNYSITHASDTRDYEALSTLQLYSKDGRRRAGSRPLIRARPTRSEVVVQRPESVINYEYLEDQKNFPAAVKLGDIKATWEGSGRRRARPGVHHFLLKNAGYAKLYIDGKEVVNKWRQAWNPGTSVVTGPTWRKGRKYTL